LLYPDELRAQNKKEHLQIYGYDAKETSFFRTARSPQEKKSCKKQTITVNLKSVSVINSGSYQTR